MVAYALLIHLAVKVMFLVTSMLSVTNKPSSSVNPPNIYPSFSTLVGISTLVFLVTFTLSILVPPLVSNVTVYFFSHPFNSNNNMIINT